MISPKDLSKSIRSKKLKQREPDPIDQEDVSNLDYSEDMPAESTKSPSYELPSHSSLMADSGERQAEVDPMRAKRLERLSKKISRV
jgi:hypothetical protein